MAAVAEVDDEFAFWTQELLKTSPQAHAVIHDNIVVVDPHRWRYTVQKHDIHAWSGLETKDLGRTNTSSLVLPAKKWSCGRRWNARAAPKRPDLTRGLWGCPTHHSLSVTGVAFGYPLSSASTRTASGIFCGFSLPSG